MFSFINSIFKISGGTNSDSTFRKTIISVLETNKIKYSEILSGITFTLNDFNDYNIIIPESFIDDRYIQIKLSLKDKDGHLINCVYLYKYVSDSLKFVNRIKIIDINNTKCDEDDKRIDLKILKSIEEILNEIFKRDTRVGGNNIMQIEATTDQATTDGTTTYGTTTAETTTDKTTTDRATTDEDQTTEVTTEDRITTTDKLDMKYLISTSKYRTLQKIMNVTLSE